MIRRILDRYFIKKPKLRETLTGLIFGNSDKTINIFGLQLTINSLKENGYLRAHKKTQHSSLLEDEIPVLINLANQVKEGGCFLDVGANVGIYASIFARLSKCLNRFDVYAFEVNPDTFNRLLINSKRNGFEALNKGVAEANRSLEFVCGAVSHVTTLRCLQNSYSIPNRTFKAECITIDSLNIKSKNVVLKIDVEGQEFNVLSGSLGLFTNNQVIAVYVDGYEDPRVYDFLSKYCTLYDGRTLNKATRETFSLLALRNN